jgi:hypothetical protein
VWWTCQRQPWGLRPLPLHRRARTGRRHGLRGHRIGLGLEVAQPGVLRQAQRAAQIGQKALLCGALAAVCIAHADGHFVGQLAVRGVGERGHGTRHRHTLEQHVLVQGGQGVPSLVVAQRFGDAPDGFALAVGLVAIGKSGEQGQGEQGVAGVLLHASPLGGGEISGAAQQHRSAAQFLCSECAQGMAVPCHRCWR